jgi:nucleoside-diphosphate-sugar epimerase
VSWVLVTGANGFVGGHLCRWLEEAGENVRGAVRDSRRANGVAAETVSVVGDIGPATGWDDALAGIGCVVHLAARVHVMREDAVDPAAAFRQVNVLGTERLAKCAAAAGVRRLVYVSSVKVNGEETGRSPFSETDAPAPGDAYSRSKWEAEQALHTVARETGLEVVIVRPPLVYGPGVGGNLLRLLRLIDRGIPLPLGSIKNRRSLISVWNLCSMLELCVSHPGAAGETFLAADGEDLSTPALFGHLAEGLGKKARLLPFPPRLLRLAGRMVGQGAAVQRLTGSLQVDVSKAATLLGWRPAMEVAEGLARTASWYRDENRGA